MNEIKNLLAENRKALQGLHAIANMDFQQPFTIIERTGKFTCNSIMKELGKPDIDETNIFILYKSDKTWNYGKCYIARLTNGKFESDRRTIKGYETASGWRWFDTMIGKSDFEECRKSENGHYFIIAQEKQFENRRGTAYYMQERFREREKCGRRCAIPYYRNGDYFYNNILTEYDSRTFDKSGYCQQVNNYAQRVRALKSERSEAAAAVWDNTEKCAEVETRIHKINARIAELTAAPVHEIPYMKIYHCYMSISWINNSLKALYKNDFSSMENLNHTVSYIESQLAKAESELDREDD